jgi:hypothetical protein
MTTAIHPRNPETNQIEPATDYDEFIERELWHNYGVDLTVLERKLGQFVSLSFGVPEIPDGWYQVAHQRNDETGQLGEAESVDEILEQYVQDRFGITLDTAVALTQGKAVKFGPFVAGWPPIER